MPLTSTGEPAVFDLEGARFAMMDGAKRVICHVETPAIEDIEHSHADKDERVRIFERQRAVFEGLASTLYDQGLPPRVTTKHIGG